MLWHRVEMCGGPLDGATVCVPLRARRIDHWIWAHECVTFDGVSWQWANACMSGFYQLAATAGSSRIDGQALDVPQSYAWHDLTFADNLSARWEFGD